MHTLCKNNKLLLNRIRLYVKIIAEHMFEVKEMDRLKKFIINTPYIDVTISSKHVTATEYEKEISCYVLDGYLIMYWGNTDIKILISDITQITCSKNELIIMLKEDEKIILKNTCNVQ